MKNEKLKKALLEIANDCVELNDIMINTIYNTDSDNAQDFINELDKRICEQEIVYYSRAIEYLAEHDASLRDSLELAHDLGYTTEQLNSELLATLLYQDNLRNELQDITKDIEQAFDDNDNDDD